MHWRGIAMCCGLPLPPLLQQLLLLQQLQPLLLLLWLLLLPLLMQPLTCSCCCCCPCYIPCVTYKPGCLHCLLPAVGPP